MNNKRLPRWSILSYNHSTIPWTMNPSNSIPEEPRRTQEVNISNNLSENRQKVLLKHKESAKISKAHESKVNEANRNNSNSHLYSN